MQNTPKSLQELRKQYTNPELSKADARFLKLFINGKVAPTSGKILKRLKKSGLIVKGADGYFLTAKAKIYAKRWETTDSRGGGT